MENTYTHQLLKEIRKVRQNILSFSSLISLDRDTTKDDFKIHSEHSHSHHCNYPNVHHKKHEHDSSDSTSFPHLIHKNRVSLKSHKKKSTHKYDFDSFSDSSDSDDSFIFSSSDSFISHSGRRHRSHSPPCSSISSFHHRRPRHFHSHSKSKTKKKQNDLSSSDSIFSSTSSSSSSLLENNSKDKSNFNYKHKKMNHLESFDSDDDSCISELFSTSLSSKRNSSSLFEPPDFVQFHLNHQNINERVHHHEHERHSSSIVDESTIGTIPSKQRKIKKSKQQKHNIAIQVSPNKQKTHDLQSSKLETNEKFTYTTVSSNANDDVEKKDEKEKSKNCNDKIDKEKIGKTDINESKYHTNEEESKAKTDQNQSINGNLEEEEEEERKDGDENENAKALDHPDVHNEEEESKGENQFVSSEGNIIEEESEFDDISSINSIW